jgi:hypothetical protein
MKLQASFKSIVEVVFQVVFANLLFIINYFFRNGRRSNPALYYLNLAVWFVCFVLFGVFLYYKRKLETMTF